MVVRRGHRSGEVQQSYDTVPQGTVHLHQARHEMKDVSSTIIRGSGTIEPGDVLYELSIESLETDCQPNC